MARLNIKQMKINHREFNLFIYRISRNYISDSKLRSEWIYLGSHILAMISSEERGTPPFPGCDQLPPPQCGIWGDSVALNWAIIGIAPFLVWAVYNFRKRRTASALIFISGLGIIIFVMSREGKSQEAPTEAVYYYHNDHLGTPKVLTDQNGTIQWEAVMEPFGEIDTFIASNANNPFRFPGQYEDDLTGLYYNHHRYYMPGLGRYNRLDLINCTNFYYHYLYSGNNPIIYIDHNSLARYYGTCSYASGGVIGGVGIMHCDVFGECGVDSIRQRGELLVTFFGLTLAPKILRIGITGFPVCQEDYLYGRGDIINMGGSASLYQLSFAAGIGRYWGLLFLGHTVPCDKSRVVQSGIDLSLDIFQGISIPYNIEEECCTK